MPTIACTLKTKKDFGREILLGGDLTDEQRQKPLEIADKCPVHRTLTSEILIETQLLNGLFSVASATDSTEYLGW